MTSSRRRCAREVGLDVHTRRLSRHQPSCLLWSRAERLLSERRERCAESGDYSIHRSRPIDDRHCTLFIEGFSCVVQFLFLPRLLRQELTYIRTEGLFSSSSSFVYYFFPSVFCFSSLTKKKREKKIRDTSLFTAYIIVNAASRDLYLYYNTQMGWGAEKNKC